MISAVATAILRIGGETPGGEGNFNFAATFNCRPGIPYFPAGYHAGATPSFSVGLENPGLLVAAVSSGVSDAGGGGGSLAACTTRLRRAIEAAVMPIQEVCTALAAESGVQVCDRGHRLLCV